MRIKLKNFISKKILDESSISSSPIFEKEININVKIPVKVKVSEKSLIGRKSRQILSYGTELEFKKTIDKNVNSQIKTELDKIGNKLKIKNLTKNEEDSIFIRFIRMFSSV